MGWTRTMRPPWIMQITKRSDWHCFGRLMSKYPSHVPKNSQWSDEGSLIRTALIWERWCVYDSLTVCGLYHNIQVYIRWNHQIFKISSKNLKWYTDSHVFLTLYPYETVLGACTVQKRSFFFFNLKKYTHCCTYTHNNTDGDKLQVKG